MKRVIFLLCLLLSAAPAQAQLGSLFGFGPRSSGMGTASLIQGSPSAYQVYGAPAALGFLRRVEVSAGAQYFDPRLKPFGTLVLNSNGTQGEFPTAGVLPGAGQTLAFAFPIGKVRPLTIAGTVYLPFSSMIRVSGSPVNYPFYPLYTDISRNFYFVLGLGYELFDGIGLGLNFRSTTKSTTVYSLRADSSVNYSATATEARGESRVSVSLLYDNERRNPQGAPYSVGAMYRAQAGLETKISADVTAFVPVQGVIISLPSFSPAEWVLMGSFRAGKWVFSADAAWVKWSQYVSPYGTGNINTYVVGTREGAGFKDIPVARVGFERRAEQSGRVVQALLFRGGYLFHPSPVPDQTGDNNFVDNDRHAFTGGLGMAVANPWREGEVIDFDLFFQYNWLKRREVRKVSALNVGAPGYVTGGKILVYGAGATLKF